MRTNLQLNNTLLCSTFDCVVAAFKVDKFLLFHCLLQQQQKKTVYTVRDQRHAVYSLVEQHHIPINCEHTHTNTEDRMKLKLRLKSRWCYTMCRKN